MRFNSLAFRLFATSAAWTLFVLPLAGIIIFQLYRDDVQASFDGRIEKLVNAIAIDSLSSGGNEPVAPVNRYEPLFEETHAGWYWQIRPLDDVTGNRLVSASLATATLPSPLEEKVAPDANGARWLNTTGPVGEPIRMVEVVDTNNHVENAGRYSVIVAGPVDWLESRNANFLTRLAIALALSGLGLLAVTLFQIRFGLLPLRAIERGLSDVRSGKASKLEGELPTEIEPLQSELNALLRSNQEIVERARTQVGNLAHALKTPLAVITNEAREDKTPLGTKVAEQATIMRDQVSHYLDRARMAARVSVIGRLTDVPSVVEPLRRALERIHRERGVAITVNCPAGLRFQGERHDLEEMLGNLLDNACKWAKSNVYLNVSKKGAGQARTGPSRIVITVEDDGPGLTEDQRKRIGKRGLRLDETKPGSGLGLSIVTELVQLYHGDFALAQSPHGGLTVRLELPGL
ncbi:MAG: ATP-binding protein [Hyphomicrobiaceae bacterium]|nr:ATP-binding protein [Hyphomicrobiaceae bacterium]